MNSLSLTPAEHQLLLNLFGEALQSASQSFSKLLGKTVNPSSLTLSETFVFPLDIDANGDTLHYNLTTEVKGECPAQSHLIFNTKDASALMELCFQHQPYSQTDMESFLLEVDNILSASVVSKLADFSGKFMYGYVPSLAYSSAEDLHALIYQDQQQWAITLSLCCKLTIENTAVSPIFIWNFSAILIEHLLKKNYTL